MTKRLTIKNKKLVDSHHKPALTQLVDGNGKTIHLEAQFPYEVRENESGSWIAHSPHFKTFGYSAKSEEDATNKFRIAIDTFFTIHLKRGTLEKALLSLKFNKVNNVIQKPKLFNASRTATGTFAIDGHKVAAIA